MFSLEHIGIAVKNLDQANSLYEKLLGTPPYKSEVVTSEKVTTSFFQLKNTKIELLESTDEMGTINKFIEKRGEGIHHFAFLVEDIHAEMKRLSQEGFQIIGDEPKVGADNKWVIFLHPKSTNGVLIELCQEIS